MNVLGGYQKINLSTADLTASTLSVEGLSKACANANGKAVLAKMPDGTEAFGAVKEVTGGYQLSVMSADSKVSQLTVDDTDDTFTMSESIDLTDAADRNAVPVGLDSSVDIKSYTDAYYTVPADGYIKMQYGAATETGSYTQLNVKREGGIVNLARTSSSGAVVVDALFVKKGTPIKFEYNGSQATCYFYALAY